MASLDIVLKEKDFTDGCLYHNQNRMVITKTDAFRRGERFAKYQGRSYCFSSRALSLSVVFKQKIFVPFDVVGNRTPPAPSTCLLLVIRTFSKVIRIICHLEHLSAERKPTNGIVDRALCTSLQILI